MKEILYYELDENRDLAFGESNGGDFAQEAQLDKERLKVVYSPLNGAGKHCITKVLEAKGINDIHIVEEQSEPDGNFPTCPYPNPEIKEAMELGIKFNSLIAFCTFSLVSLLIPG